MIHHRECKRCTHEWTNSCCSGFFETGTEKEKERRHDYHHRQLVSGLCHDCYDMLAAGELGVNTLAVFDLCEYLNKKSDQLGYAGRMEGHFVKKEKYSGMTNEYCQWSEDTQSIIILRPFEAGFTAEQEQLHEIRSDMKQVYLDFIRAQRTPARIQLDEYRDSLVPPSKDGEPSMARVGWILCGNAPKPEGFVPDPPGKARPTIRFGLDLRTGGLLAPHIVMEDGTI